jgi:hypothetical protein
MFGGQLQEFGLDKRLISMWQKCYEIIIWYQDM